MQHHQSLSNTFENNIIRATTACDPRIRCAAAAAPKIDRLRIDLTRKAGLFYLIDPQGTAGVASSVGARACAATGARPAACSALPPCSRANYYILSIVIYRTDLQTRE
ncbi:unnamed protein product, partial [Brenthis ino]